MFFTSPNDFSREPIKIANVNQTGEMAQMVARFIGQYEKQCLVSVLGECLYNDVAAAFVWVTDHYELREDAPQNILDLINGKTYTPPADNNDVLNWARVFWFWPYLGYGFPWSCDCGCGESTCTNRVWKGITQTENYVFNGEQKTFRSSFIYHYIYYYWMLYNRSFSVGTGQTVAGSENGTTVENFSKRIDAYNEFIFGIAGRPNTVSLYRYLCDNKADYPTWKPNCNLEFKNKF